MATASQAFRRRALKIALTNLVFVIGISAHAPSLQAHPAQEARSSPIRILVTSGTDIGAQVNAAIKTLQGKPGTIELPAGSYIQSRTISVSGTGVRILGASAGTVLNYDSVNYRLVDSADSTNGWKGSGVKFAVQNEIGEDHPDPIQGDGYLEVDTQGGGERQVSKSIPSTSFDSAANIGVWLTLNLTMGPPHEIEFFVSDGLHLAYWKLKPLFFHDQWRFFELDRPHPSGDDGGLPDMKAITAIGFRGLIPGAKYYFGPVSLYTPTGPSIVFTSCAQCSLEDVRIQWEPAAGSDPVVEVGHDSHEVVLTNVHTVGGANGFSLTGNSSESTCKACTAEAASVNGFYLQGNTMSNQLLDVQANRNVTGIVVGQGSTHNFISSPHLVRDNSSGMIIDGSDNQITNPYLETWMSMGLVVRGATRNSISGLVASSAVGETAVQFFGNASYNTLSNTSIEQSGGNGLDLGGGAGLPFENTIDSLTVHNSGRSSWHGGPGATAEGRGICICGATGNSFSHVQLYDAGQQGGARGVEGILITGSSRNRLDDVLIEHAKHEGISMWGSSDNQMHNIRLVNNGSAGKYYGMRIDPTSQRTTIDDICYAGNSGGALQDLSHSSVISNARKINGSESSSGCP